MLFGRLVVSSWYNPDSDTCWVAVAPVLASKAVATTELFWRGECVQVIYNDVARVAVWNLHASLRFARHELRFDGNPLALYWLPGDQTRTISNAEVVLFIHGGCLDVLLVFCAH
jgi:hypothetical protein